MPIPLEVVKKYAPSWQFHEDERCFPCSIEHLLHNSVLYWRNFAWPTQIPGQSSSSTPTLAAYKGWCYMAYQDGSGFQMYITRSNDGNTWQNTQKIPGVQGGGPTLVVFKGKLWLIWHGTLSAQLYIASTEDGLTWSGIQEVKGREAWKTSIAVYDDRLFMVYTDVLGSQLFMSQSVDGVNWIESVAIEGQLSSQASITNFNNSIVMVYSHAKIDNNTLYITSYTSKSGWSTPQAILGHETASPVLTTIGKWLFLSYPDANLSSQFWAVRSRDGVVWKEKLALPGQHGDIPALAVYEDTVYMAYRLGRDLWFTWCENGDLTIHPPILNPTQETLGTHSNPSYYVEINPEQYPGQPIPEAPMYYAVQQNGDQLTIHYPILYANQTGQTCRALRLGSNFDAILETLGDHQGDFERFNITLQKLQDGSYKILQAGFEAHGNLITFTPDQVKWEDDTHAIVHPALNGHASRNRDPKDGPIPDVLIPGIVLVGDFPGNGQWWRPASDGSAFKLLGLDGNGVPIGDQKWAAFQGHLGDTKMNSLEYATYFDGRRIMGLDWDYVDTVFGVASSLNLLSNAQYVGDAPMGPNGWDRTWVQNSADAPPVLTVHEQTRELIDKPKIVKLQSGKEEKRRRFRNCAC